MASRSTQQPTSDEEAPNRRTRLHDWTRAEIKAAALRQLEEHGVEGISLNAIAKDLGMTGPALYRYVGSRDELLAELVVDAWEELASALENAAEQTAERSAAERLGAIGIAYRTWALTQPDRYKLAIHSQLGSGEVAADRVIPAAARAMNVILDAMDGLHKASKPKAKLRPELQGELETWTKRVGGPDLPPAILLHGVVFWSRLHGLISLELDHHLASMQLDPELLYLAELRELGAETED